MSREADHNAIFIQVLAYPERKAVLYRPTHLNAHIINTKETNQGIWAQLCGVKEALYEPVGMWLPPHMQRKAAPCYVPAVEVPADFCGCIPIGFELLHLPACTMMLFQTHSCFVGGWHQIAVISAAIRQFDPTLYGYEWDKTAPSIQMRPSADRGYIEGHAVKKREYLMVDSIGN